MCSYRVKLSGNRIGQSAASPFAATEFPHRVLEIGGCEIRPPFRQKDKFREGAFPQEKIGKPLLASSPDEEIHFRRASTKDLCEDLRKRLRR
jgi:hypothetical protein